MRLNADGILDLVDLIHAGGTCDDSRRRSVEALSDAFGGAAVMIFRQAGAVVEDLDHARWPAGRWAVAPDDLQFPHEAGAGQCPAADDAGDGRGMSGQAR